jgi:hypothetical protein
VPKNKPVGIVCVSGSGVIIFMERLAGSEMDPYEALLSESSSTIEREDPHSICFRFDQSVLVAHQFAHRVTRIVCRYLFPFLNLVSAEIVALQV